MKIFYVLAFSFSSRILVRFFMAMVLLSMFSVMYVLIMAFVIRMLYFGCFGWSFFVVSFSVFLVLDWLLGGLFGDFGFVLGVLFVFEFFVLVLGGWMCRVFYFLK